MSRSNTAQPETVNNIEECEPFYLKLIPKPQVTNREEQQVIDMMTQKMRAKVEEVHFLADIGMSILVEVTSHQKPHSCFTNFNSHSPKHVRFNIQEHGATDARSQPPAGHRLVHLRHASSRTPATNSPFISISNLRTRSGQLCWHPCSLVAIQFWALVV